jgi:PTH2 family peptidyl-tRNA hydrolase
MPVEKNPYDDEKLAAIRAGQEDPLVQYFIVRKDLDMSPGKIAAQVAHAAQMVALKYFEYKFSRCIPRDIGKEIKAEVFKKWMDESFRKVILKADEKQFEKVKEEAWCQVVKDAGLTEVETGTETVLVLWPMKKSEVPKVIQRLRVM